MILVTVAVAAVLSVVLLAVGLPLAFAGKKFWDLCRANYVQALFGFMLGFLASILDSYVLLCLHTNKSIFIYNDRSTVDSLQKAF